MALASQLAPGKSITPSLSIMGNRGVKAKRPMPMAAASANMPPTIMAHGLASTGAFGPDIFSDMD